MGRRKIHPETKAIGVSVSLSPKSREKLNELMKFYGLRKISDTIRLLIDKAYEKMIRGDR